jgi:hypothetical protein
VFLESLCTSSGRKLYSILNVWLLLLTPYEVFLR